MSEDSEYAKRSVVTPPSIDTAIAVIARSAHETQRSYAMYVQGRHDLPSWEELDMNGRCGMIDRVREVLQGKIIADDVLDHVIAGCITGLNPLLKLIEPLNPPRNPGESN